MPELYGQPFKDELRAKIAELENDFRNERKKYSDACHKLQYARARITILEAQLSRIRAAAEGITSETSRDIGPETFQEYRDAGRRAVAEIIAQAEAAA